MNMLNDILCVILARGGSKGIPGKNLKLLGGIPLVAHSILHAKKWIAPTCIVVSSDDQDILNVAKEYGVTSCVRPDEFATDEASSESALIHAVETFEEEKKDVLFLQPTSPIRFRDTILNFVNYHRSGGYDSCLTTTKFPRFFWFHEYNEHSPLSPTYQYQNRPRKQDMKVSYFRYFDNGNAYVMKRELLLKEKCRLGGKVGVFPISELEAIQIDTPEEFATLEAIFEGEVNQWTGTGVNLE